MNDLTENMRRYLFEKKCFFQERTPIDMQLVNQHNMLVRCVENGVSLASELQARGLNYDSLQYKNNSKPVLTDSCYFTLQDFANKANHIPVVSFFSGAGGLDLGLEAAGFSHVHLIEKNPLFCATLKHNRPYWQVSSGDVSDTQAMIDMLSPTIGTSSFFDGIFVGGPPCQPFSIAANQRFNKDGKDFKRVGFSHATNGNLLFEYIALIKHFKPRVFLIENVPGLIDVDGGEQLERAYSELESAGYRVEQPAIMNTAYFSVPQQRVRLFIVGNRMGKEFTPPKPTLHPLPVGAVFELPLTYIANHTTREHSAQSVMRYMQLEYGCRDKLGRVDRLDPKAPSKTVIAGGSSGGGRSHLHPYIPRTLSVRECARIQTFPDDYVFLGSSARQFTQVGNAVPPVLAAQLGKAIFSSFYS